MPNRLLFTSGILVSLLIPSLLTACGAQNGAVEGQVLGMYATTDQPKILQGATVLIAGSKGDHAPVTTGSDGHFKVSLPYDNYNFEATYQGLKARQKTIQVNSDTTESAGFVLVADGIDEPASPPPPPPNPQQYGRSESMASDPWFWFWMFDRPYYYGYSRPAWVTYGSSSTVVVIDRRTDPVIAANNKGYTAYSDPANPKPGTKAAPVAQTIATGSKGVTKPGTGGAAANNAAPVAPPSSGSKAGGAAGSSSSSGGASGSGAGAPAAPPSSGGSRGSSSGGGSKGKR